MRFYGTYVPNETQKYMHLSKLPVVMVNSCDSHRREFWGKWKIYFFNPHETASLD